MNFLSSRNRIKRNQQGFALVETLVAASVSAVFLTVSVAILNRQIEASARGREMAAIRQVINQDIKAVRQFASIWNLQSDINLFANPNLVGSNYPDAMVYNSDPNCQAWSSVGSLETNARSDLKTYSSWFPYVSPIWQSNVATIPVSSTASYEIRRAYTLPSQQKNSAEVGIAGNNKLDEVPLTIRITYSLMSVKKDGNTITRSKLDFQQSADVNLVAQFSC